MSIDPIRSDSLRRPDRGTAAEPVAREPQKGDQSAAEPVRPIDRVEISAEGRALAGAPVAERPEEAQLSAARLAEIRQRIQSGAYMTPEVLDALAHQVLASGDL